MKLHHLRRKLFYVPLALHLTLQGCAAVQLLTPASQPVMIQQAGAVLVDSHEQGTHRLSIHVQPTPEYALQALQHHWSATDVVKYTLKLKSSDDGYTASLASADLAQKGTSIATQATFTGLSASKTYKVFLETYGNNGGTTLSTSLIDGQHPQASGPIAFTSSNDQQDSYTVTLAPTLDSTTFNGQIGVSVSAPTLGGLTSTLTPTYSLSYVPQP